MTWSPTSEDEIQSLIASEVRQMQPPLVAFWESVKINPVRWSLPPWGDSGGGFWVVAVMGQQCIWFNDVEDGFNASRFESFGIIAEYWCNQLRLHQCLSRSFETLMQAIAGKPTPPTINCGPPEKISGLK
jgi:hypothetical protein